MKLKPYPEYKPSGVDWLGEVPNHWKVSPFKWQIERNDGGVWGDDPVADEGHIVLRSTEQTVDGRWQIEEPARRDLSDAEQAAALLVEGDLLVTKSSGSSLHIGKTTIVDSNVAALQCCYSNFMQRIRTRPSLLPRLAWYVMNNRLARLQFDLLSNSTTGLANLNGTMIGQLLLTTPPFAEQTAITAFLDREIAKIDTLIAKQEGLIELLREKRQAVISHAVTKGLDPTVPMKPSGVEWLGDVPEHWAVIPTKRLFQLVVDPAPPNNDSTLLSIYTDIGVRPRKELEERGNKASTTDGYFQVRKGDLIVNKLLAWMGAIGISNYDGVTSPAYDILRPIGDVSPHYYDFLFRCGICFTEFRRFSRGIMDMRLRLYFEEFGQLHMPRPPADEMQAIVDHIDAETLKIDTLIAKAQQAIVLQKEHRTALISAAVTGKIDVRGLADSHEVVEEKAA